MTASAGGISAASESLFAPMGPAIPRKPPHGAPSLMILPNTLRSLDRARVLAIEDDQPIIRADGGNAARVKHALPYGAD